MQPAKQVSQFDRWGFGRETALDQPLPGLIGEPRRAFEACPAVRRFGDAGLVQELFGEANGTDAVAAGDRRQIQRHSAVLFDHQGVLAITDAAHDFLDRMLAERDPIVQQADGDRNRCWQSGGARGLETGIVQRRLHDSRKVVVEPAYRGAEAAAQLSGEVDADIE